MGDIDRDAQLDALVEAYRFGEVGRCVNSVAHDANNSLGVILAYAELIGMEPTVEGEARRMLNEIESATRRAAEQLSWLTDVARPAQAARTKAKLAEVVRRSIALRHYEAKHAGVDLRLGVSEDLPDVSITIPVIERAVIYLFANALDAVGNADKKYISIEGRTTGDTVTLQMRDCADPIPDAHADRMFEPFFTTKGGNHLGLGLFAARRAAEADGGTLTYRPGEGFHLALPLA